MSALRRMTRRQVALQAIAAAEQGCKVTTTAPLSKAQIKLKLTQRKTS